MKKIILLLVSLYLVNSAQAQNTVGLLSYNESQAEEGYNLFYPHNQGSVFLMDNCGEIVNEWEDFTYTPGNGVKLHTDGNIYICKSRGPASNSYIHAGGGGELLEVRDWDNNLVWQFVYNDSTHRLHHDLAVKPDGNVLLIAWEYKTEQEAIDAGRDTALLAESLWPDEIIEVAPDGNGGGTIVWRWRAWDHLVQDFDPAKANFGVVAASPELIDVNAAPDDNPDWMHSNSIDYNPTYQQVLLSVPPLNEIWIIDQSTTTAQAAGHNGGFSGKGGDLLFRWGNPANYDAGTAADQKLFYQHDAHWVDIGLNSGHQDFYKIAIFNNRVGADFSTANLIAPIFDSYEIGYPMDNGVWGPSDFDWSYTAPIPQDMYSNILSSVQRLPDGNTLISTGRPGYTFELNPNEEIVWEYKNPMLSGNPVAQGTTLPLSANLHFTMKRYAPDYAGLAGKDLTPKGWIELNPDSTFCDRLVDIRDIPLAAKLEIFPNPVADFLQVNIKGNLHTAPLAVYNSLGAVVFKQTDFRFGEQVDVRGWATGIYFIRLADQTATRFVKH